MDHGDEGHYGFGKHMKPALQTRRRSARPLVGLLAVVGFATAVTATFVAQADGPTTFSNTTSIAIPALGSANQIGPANPYPSITTVSGMTGTISAVTVTLSTLTHPLAQDVDILLVAPTGAKLVVLSDVANAGGFGVNGTLTLSDAAASLVPSTGVIGTGTYKPTNYAVGPDDGFPAPGPRRTQTPRSPEPSPASTRMVRGRCTWSTTPRVTSDRWLVDGA